MYFEYICINPLASPSTGAPALKYGDVNTVTPSPGEVKGLKIHLFLFNLYYILILIIIMIYYL